MRAQKSIILSRDVNYIMPSSESGRNIVAPKGVCHIQGDQRGSLLIVLSGSPKFSSSHRFPCFSFSYTTHPIIAPFLGATITLSQSSRKVPEPLHLRSPTNVNIKLFIFHGVFTITISTTTHSSTGPFLRLRRRTITPVTQLKRQNMARA